MFLKKTLCTLYQNINRNSFSEIKSMNKNYNEYYVTYKTIQLLYNKESDIF